MALPKTVEKKPAAAKKLTPVKVAAVKAPPSKPEPSVVKAIAKESKAAPVKERKVGARSDLYDKKITAVAPIEEARRVPAEGSEPTATYLRYKLYKTGQTVREFLEKGGRMVDVNWDVKHGFVKLA